MQQISFFFLKDLFCLFLLTIYFIGYKIKYVPAKELVTITFYTLMICILISFSFRIVSYQSFETYFLKTELIFFVLTIAIGVLVKPRHMLVFLITNFTFISVSYFSFSSYPFEKYLFYGSLVIGSGIIGYYIHTYFQFLNREIVQKNKIIKIKNKKLFQLSNSKDELINILGHDLKTPFSQVLGLSYLLESEETLLEQNEAIAHIKNAATNGIKIINDLLLWNINLKNTDYKKEFRPYDLVEKIISLNQIDLVNKKIKVKNNCKPSLQINYNETLIETLLRNLVSNSIKFSKPNSNILIDFKSVDAVVIFSVQDFGTGISPETLNKINNLEKVNSANGTNNEKGNGMGLLFCKKIIEENNGILTIKSTMDKGTHIEVTLSLLPL